MLIEQSENVIWSVLAITVHDDDLVKFEILIDVCQTESNSFLMAEVAGKMEDDDSLDVY